MLTHTPGELRSRPYPPHWTVRAGRDAYLAENRFTVAAYDEPTTEANFFGLRVRVPNTPRHRRALRVHDLHHVVTGYGTDLIGEGEISAWELRRGLRPCGAYVASIVTAGAAFGFLIAPRRIIRAFQRAAGKRSLFHLKEEDYEGLLDLSIGALRVELGVPAEGLANRPRRLHWGARPRRSAA